MTINGLSGVHNTPTSAPTQGSGMSSQEDTKNVTQAPENPDYSVSISKNAQALSVGNVQVIGGVQESLNAIAAENLTNGQAPTATSQAAQANAATQRFYVSSVEGSFLLDFQHGTVHADAGRGALFFNLFQMSNEDAVAQAHLSATSRPGDSRTPPPGWLANTVESSIARHAELRDEVHRAFGHDSELLAANLTALDRAFENNMQRIAQSISDAARFESGIAESRAVFNAQVERFGTGHEFIRHHEPHALANHRDFNSREFERNTRDMISQLTQFHLGQMNSANSNNAWQATMDFMSSMFGTTTSVNSLSFNDLMLVQNNFGSSSAVSTGNANDDRNAQNSAFNSSVQMSSELRSLLGG